MRVSSAANDPEARQKTNLKREALPMFGSRQEPTTSARKSLCEKKGVYIILVLIGAALPITQLLLGNHYIALDKTNASRFLIANAIVYFYLLILGFCKVSKRCVGFYKCCFGIFIIPLVCALGIGIAVFVDSNAWSIAYMKEDYKYCNPVIFTVAYGLNVINYFIFAAYMINRILNHFGQGLTTSTNSSRAIYCCGELV